MEGPSVDDLCAPVGNHDAGFQGLVRANRTGSLVTGDFAGDLRSSRSKTSLMRSVKGKLSEKRQKEQLKEMAALVDKAWDNTVLRLGDHLGDSTLSELFAHPTHTVLMGYCTKLGCKLERAS